MSNYEETMLLLVDCLGKMRERGLKPDEIHLLCMLSNGMYLICLNALHIQQIHGGALPDMVSERFDAGIAALHQMLEIYRDNHDDAVLDAAIKGIRAAYNFQEAKRAVNESLNHDEIRSQSHSESLASKEEASHG